MGIVMSRIYGALNSLSGNKEKRILMLGLDAAGKTSIVNKLAFDEARTTIPTIGFNCEQVIYKNICFTVWDIGGQDKIRRLWNHYYNNTDALIFVVDSNDRSRIEEAKGELKRLLEEEQLRDIAVLVYANKMDLPNSMSNNEVVDKLDLRRLAGHRHWLCHSSCATDGQGLYEGLEWLSKTLNKN